MKCLFFFLSVSEIRKEKTGKNPRKVKERESSQGCVSREKKQKMCLLGTVTFGLYILTQVNSTLFIHIIVTN